MGYGQGNSGMHQNFSKMSRQQMQANLLGGLSGDYGDADEAEEDNMDDGEENLDYE